MKKVISLYKRHLILTQKNVLSWLKNKEAKKEIFQHRHFIHQKMNILLIKRTVKVGFFSISVQK